MSTSYKQPNFTSYVKYFNNASSVSLNTWVNNGSNSLTPANKGVDVYIPNNLTVGGTTNIPSDIKLKDNIENIDTDLLDNLMSLAPKKYTYKKDAKQKTHYGFIAQEMEQVLPHLVTDIEIEEPAEGDGLNTIMNKYKAINYLELIPLLLMKIQDMQKQLDELKSK